VPFDRDLDRDHAAFLTERSVTTAIRTLQRALSGDDRFARIAESIARDSVESAEAKTAWNVAAGQAAASALCPGLQLQRCAASSPSTKAGDTPPPSRLRVPRKPGRLGALTG